ncbi:MAG: hypothetical protein HY961_15615 [Ignavibacteriae bacterium]|nr:hypothetical protein [Ignavibacteriota bacterium]
MHEDKIPAKNNYSQIFSGVRVSPRNTPTAYAIYIMTSISFYLLVHNTKHH